jgi:hypothetical protein
MADYTSAQRFATFCERHPQEWSFSAGNVEQMYNQPYTTAIKPG